ncbi:MAG: amidohydrolase [Mariniblastus sp.]|nr:amidohydrolase [Mariniblastus sp.]
MKNLTTFWTICFTLFSAPMILHGQSTGDESAPTRWLKTNQQDLEKLYLHFHRNPELSLQENETAARFGQELEAAGCQVTYNVGGHGVVGILTNGDGPTVMVRSDLDGLPVVEQTNQPYASTRTAKDRNGNEVGVMHACGHDMHMTSLIGVARFMADHKNLWSGRLMFIGQPAEELGKGAEAMLNDGLYSKFGKPDYALALHCHPDVAAGQVQVRGGYTMANVDSVDIELFGRGGHGATPHLAIDPVVQAARLIMDVQTIVSREINATDPSVITVGSIHAGTKHNIIPDTCHLQLTVRSYSDEVRQQLLDAIRRKAKATAESAGAPEPEVVVSEGTPSTRNDEKLTATVRRAFAQALGQDNVQAAELQMWGEDFSRFGRSGVPSVMYFLGVVTQQRLDRYHDLGTVSPPLHSDQFYPDIEPAVRTGVTSMASAVLELMKRN